MSEDSPKIVDIEASPELSEFLSEFEFPSEEVVASASPAAVGRGRRRGRDVPFATSRSRTVLPRQPLSERRRWPGPCRRRPTRSTPNLNRKPMQLFGPATVTEFPSSAAGDSGCRHVGTHRAGNAGRSHRAARWIRVARSCGSHPSDLPAPEELLAAAPILLDPRNIQISDHGEVRLLSGQTAAIRSSSRSGVCCERC